MAAARKQMEAAMANMSPEQRAAMEKMMGGGAAKGAPPKPVYKRTGKQSKVSGFDCEIVTYTIGSETGELCVAAPGEIDMPDSDVRTLQQFGAFVDRMSASVTDMGIGGRMNLSEIGGLPVRDSDEPVQIVKSISHDSLPASLFAPPAGFTREKLELQE
jgi:hypothetical protein